MSVGFAQHLEQAFGGGTGVSTTTLTLGAGVTAGDGLVLLLAATAATTGVSGCGATWVKVQSATALGGQACECWVGLGATSGSTVTITFGSNQWGDAMLVVGHGAVSASTSAQATGTSAAPATAAVSAGAAGDLVVGGFFEANFPTVSGYTDSPAAWTTAGVATQDFTTGNTYGSAYRQATGAGTHQRVATASASDQWLGFGVVLTDTTPPAGSAPRRPVVKSRAVTRAAVI